MNAIFNGFNLSFTKEIIKKTVDKFGIKNAHVIGSSVGQFSEEEANRVNAKIYNIPTKNVYDGLFSWVDFTTIPPLDAEILAEYSFLECEIIQMMSRDIRMFNVFRSDNTKDEKLILNNSANPYYYTLIEEPTYLDRKQVYMNQLRFWLWYIEKYNIDFFFIASPPHNNHEYIIYNILKQKRKFSFFPMLNIVPGSWFISDDIRKRLISEEDIEEMRQKYSDSSSITFGSIMQNEINRLKGMQKNHIIPDEYHLEFNKIPDEVRQEEKLKSKEKAMLIAHNDGRGVLKYLRKFSRFGNLDYLYFYLKFKSAVGYIQKLRRYYQQNSFKPDFKEKYFYFPFHMQPELTSAPLGGAYADQRLIVELITAYLPDDVYLYIKEHPAQKIRWRSTEYYYFLKRNKKVRFVNMSVKQNELIKNCLAVVTITGTSAIEGLFMDKPCILFGDYCFAYASGILKINNRSECKEAIEKILNGYKPDYNELMLYLKALEDKPVVASPQSYGILTTKFTKEENATVMAEAFYEYYQSILKNETFVR